MSRYEITCIVCGATMIAVDPEEIVAFDRRHTERHGESTSRMTEKGQPE
jgi:hypothetical protein